MSYLIDGQFIGIPLSDTFGALVHNRHCYVGAFQSHHRTSGATNITRTDTTHFHSTHYFLILGSALTKYMISTDERRNTFLRLMSWPYLPKYFLKNSILGKQEVQCLDVGLSRTSFFELVFRCCCYRFSYHLTAAVGRGSEMLSFFITLLF